ncbi:hypothetical protein A6V39_04685 [Candidatus Mycoplasma haematobovis]|uniref:Uncharacterized protein n=1 Tax=Candidatus Mycoplasma haematobovis TaxID=432608 RepID=A0A1A9QBK7_9MOLU|nr:hypothetical protein [Candidatus Mycoplasma haematobovis]OAL09847.1 hypothetical protein A6V39_04685 [Candidatus Mycoplasma haematobovis]
MIPKANTPDNWGRSISNGNIVKQIILLSNIFDFFNTFFILSSFITLSIWLKEFKTLKLLNTLTAIKTIRTMRVTTTTTNNGISSNIFEVLIGSSREGIDHSVETPTITVKNEKDIKVTPSSSFHHLMSSSDFFSRSSNIYWLN